jgi:hypothetical protein
VNKKVDGERKRKPREYKWERQGVQREKKKRTTGGIITAVKLGIKEKRQETAEEEGCME